jgi:hypothetical protein
VEYGYYDLNDADLGLPAVVIGERNEETLLPSIV